MRRGARAILLAGALLALAAAPAAANPCAGLARAGMGGGASFAPGAGDTLIYGTLTGFGSLCVNGIQVDYDVFTPLEDSGDVLSTNVLRTGQTLFVSAQWQGEELGARRILLVGAVQGPVTAVDAAARRLEVMGHRVEVPRGAEGILAAALDGVRPGDRVEVHGLRNQQGRIVATRVDPPRTPGASITGWPVLLPDGGWAVEGVRIEPTRSGPAPRGFALLYGHWDADARRFVAERVNELLPAGNASVSIEAFVAAHDSRRLRTPVAPVDISRLPAGGELLSPGARIWAEGSIAADGTLIAARLHLDPIGRGARKPGAKLARADEREEAGLRDPGEDLPALDDLDPGAAEGPPDVGLPDLGDTLPDLDGPPDTGPEEPPEAPGLLDLLPLL